jgi:hypothetical protein
LHLHRPAIFLICINLLVIGFSPLVYAQSAKKPYKLTRFVLVDATLNQPKTTDYIPGLGQQNKPVVSMTLISDVILDTLLNKPFSNEWISDLVTNVLVKKQRSLASNEWLQIDQLIEDHAKEQVELFLSIQTSITANQLDKQSESHIPKSSVEGVLGAFPLDENRWMLVGDLELRIPELWKVNQALDFRFTRTDIDYTSTSLRIQQPIREQFLLDAFIELEQRDSLYQQSKVGLGGGWLVDVDRKYTLNLAWENSSSTRQLQTNLHAYKAIAVELGTYQRFNVAEWNLTTQLDLRSTRQTSIQIGHQFSGNTTQWLHSVHLETTLESPKIGLGFVRINQVYDQVWAEELPWTYAIVFGGAKSLPGFYERQFDAQWAYRFKTSYVIRMKDNDFWEFFTAGAYFQFFEPNMEVQSTNQTVWSAGFSYSFRTDFGRVQLALATPLWSIYKGSKLHLNIGR